MSSEVTLQDSRIVMFKRELCLYILFSYCAIYSSIGAIYFYMNYAKYLQPDRTPHPMKDTINAVISILAIVNFVSILVNIKVNYKNRNYRIKGAPENPTIVYLMCLPLLIISLVAIMYIFVYDIYYIQCKHFPDALLASSLICIFISMIILLLDTNGIVDTGESWTLNFSNFATISLTLITILITCSFNLLLMHVFDFIHVQIDYFNNSIFDSCTKHLYPNGTTQFLILQTLKLILPYDQCCIILLTVTFFPYFIIPWRRHFVALQLVLRRQIKQTPSLQSESMGKCVTSCDTILNIVIAAVLLMLNITFLIMGQGKSSIYMEISRCIQLIIMLLLTAFILMDVTFWANTDMSQSKNGFNQTVLWIGMVGELLISFSLIIGMCSGIYKQFPSQYGIAHSSRIILQIFQTLGQTILASFIIRRKLNYPINCKTRKICNSFNPFIVLAVINGMLMLSYVIMINDPPVERDEMWKFLFMDTVLSISIPLTWLYRVFCLLLFIKIA